jgi:hypothetical protein
MKCLRHSGGDRSCARALENTDSAVPNGTRWNRIEGTNVEHAAGCRVCNVAIADKIGTLERAAIGKTKIAGIVAGTRDRREIGTLFLEAHRADGPSAESEIGETVHVREEFVILADREIVDCGEQKAIAAGGSHIAAIGREIEAVGDRDAVDDFWVKGGGCVVADVAKALCPDVASLEGEAAARISKSGRAQCNFSQSQPQTVFQLGPHSLEPPTPAA